MEMKSCPRCQGDLYIDRDQFGSYKCCIQCGFNVDIDDRSGLFRQPPGASDQAA